MKVKSFSDGGLIGHRSKGTEKKPNLTLPRSVVVAVLSKAKYTLTSCIGLKWVCSKQLLLIKCTWLIEKLLA